jgi:hypothetical protein
VRQRIAVLVLSTHHPSSAEILAPGQDLGHFEKELNWGIDKMARRVYVHSKPNADGSDSESGRRANADGARAQARNLSAFCFVRTFAISRPQ